MEILNFGTCCSAKIIYGLYNDGERAKVELKETLDNYSVKNQGLVLVILNSNQKKELHDIMLECGFKHRSRGLSTHGDGTYVHLYVKNKLEKG